MRRDRAGYQHRLIERVTLSLLLHFFVRARQQVSRPRITDGCHYSIATAVMASMIPFNNGDAYDDDYEIRCANQLLLLALLGCRRWRRQLCTNRPQPAIAFDIIKSHVIAAFLICACCYTAVTMSPAFGSLVACVVWQPGLGLPSPD